MAKTLIKNARAIVSCDSTDSVYYNTDILIEGNAISRIGKNINAADAEVIDGSDKFIYPGLVNTHHHFFQTFVRNLRTVDYPNMTVVDWLREIYFIFQRIDCDVVYYSSLTAMGDLLKHGCTTAFDHHYCFTPHTGTEAIDRQMQAAEEMGIRFHAGRGTNTLPASDGSTIPDDMLETTDAFIKDCERVIDKYHDPKPFSMRQVAVAPCQPVNCYRDTFVESVRLARAKGVRMHTHLGEGENDIMCARWGKRTLEWCENVGFIGDDVWIAHGWEVQPYEYKIMGEAHMGIAHCPGPAILGGFNVLDIPAMQRSGIIVSLGCDGSATNDSSNLLDSLRVAYLMQASKSKERNGSLLPYDLLKIATIEGAKTLGRTDIGSIEVGKAADLFMIDTNTFEMTGTLHDPRNVLARTGMTGPVWLTMVNGEVVFKNGMLLRIDESRLAREGEAVCNRVLRKPCNAFHNL
ncbi:MAG: amidohydrolase [Clostridia bacterium]